MGLRWFWIFQVIFQAALAADSGTHLHRYMLSAYRSQHNRKTQMDYKPHIPQTEDDGESSPKIQKLKPYGRGKEPSVLLVKSRKTVMLHDLIVRIYQDGKYTCVGTQVSDMLVVTAATCFDENASGLVIMKTYANEEISGQRKNLSETDLRSEDPLLVAIVLNSRPKDSKVVHDMVKLCDHKMNDYTIIEMPLWIRSRHEIHSWNSLILPVQECRYRLKDRKGKIVTNNMICAKSEQYTRRCQNSIGNPLINNYMICGVNVAGHNCPVFTGVVLYATVYDELEFAQTGIKLLEEFNVDGAIM